MFKAVTDVCIIYTFTNLNTNACYQNEINVKGYSCSALNYSF